MAQTAAEMKAARVSPRLSKRCVTAPPPHWNCSQAAKNKEKPAHPMSTVKKRWLRAILLSLTGSPAPTGISQGCADIFPSPVPAPSPPPLAEEGWEGLVLAPGFADRQRDLLDFARPDDLDRLGGADFDLAKPRIQVFQALGRRSIERNQGIPLHEAGLVGGGLRLRPPPSQAAVLGDPALHRPGQWDLPGSQPPGRPPASGL